MQFLAAPVLGALSDHFGRRPVILLSNFGLGLDYILMALAPSLSWLMIGRLISGVTSASIVTAFAYVADITAPEKRAQIVRPDGRGVRHRFRHRSRDGRRARAASVRGCPSGCPPALSLANGLYGLFILPESLGAGATRALQLAARATRSARCGCCGRTRNCWVSRPSIFSTSLAHQSLRLGVRAVRELSVPLDDDRCGMGADRRRRRVRDRARWTGRAAGRTDSANAAPWWPGCSLARRDLPFMDWPQQGGWFAAGIPIMSLWALYGPSAQGLMTRRVGPTEQGRLQGALSSVTGITGIIGPGLFSADVRELHRITARVESPRRTIPAWRPRCC